MRNRIFAKKRLSSAKGKELLWQAYLHVRSKELNEGACPWSGILLTDI